MFWVLPSLANLYTHVSLLRTSILKVIILSSEYFTLNSDCVTYYRSNAFPPRSNSLFIQQYCISMCSRPFVLLTRAACNHGNYQCRWPCPLPPHDPLGFPLERQGRRLSSFSFSLHQSWGWNLGKEEVQCPSRDHPRCGDPLLLCFGV